MKRSLFAFIAAAGLPLAASAQSVDLSYSVTDLGGGLYEYEFELTPDAGWVAGMGWRWFIFGDCVGPCTSPLTDFVGDPASLPIGPWTGYSSSGGGHNGPTLSPVLEYWIPASGGETLTWRGTSTADLQQGELLFSTIAGTIGGAVAADYKVATREGGPPPSCYADCDESGELDFFDFLCFQNAFAAGEPYADCDGSGSLDFFDFLCFQNEFAAGCEPTGGAIDQFGTEAPPTVYCDEQMTPFPLDARPVFTDVTTVPSPLGGDVVFSSACNVRQIGVGWATWSHGYTGSVYYTNGAASLDVSPPANSAFYLYVEPNPFADIEFEITRDGGDSVVETINGSSGAKGYGFCGGVKTVNVRTTDGFTDFAVGEFGIAN